MGLLLAASVIWAGDGDNYFQLAYGPANDSPLCNNNTRDVTAGSDVDQDGLYEVIVTDYDNGGQVHVFEVTGDNTLEWVWSSAGTGLTGATCRAVHTGDMDNDGIGEIIFVVCDGTWDETYEGGIHVYEWDGTTDNGYGTAPISVYKPNGANPEYFRGEDFEIGDVDGDDMNELVVTDNTITADQDGCYILSVSGTFESGFATWTEEGQFLRGSANPYGGSPLNAHIGDMDGDGKMEAIFGIWDYCAFYIVEATGANAYEYQTFIQVDTTGDGAPLIDFGVADLNNDGADEVYTNVYSGGELVALTGGADVSTITFESNVTYLALTDGAGHWGAMSMGDQDHGTGTDGWDIYTTDWTTTGSVYDFEFTGTDPTNPADWTRYTIVDDYDGSGVPVPIDAPPVDLDNDGKLEVVVGYGDAVPTDRSWFRVFEWTGETGVEEYTIAVDVPREFQLAQNYPNPFNAQTTIEYTISRPGHVSLKVFNATGQLVKTLVNDYRPINRYAVTWDGTDEDGRSVASGVYFYQLVAGEYQQAKKMSLLK